MAWGTSEKITFTGASGDQLAARLDKPPYPPLAYALFAHCFTCSKDILAAKKIASGLIENGIAVLRFDFTGLGHSDGEFANTNFSSNINDLIAASNWLAETHEAPSILIGHSLGGSAILAVAPKVPSSKAICTIGAPFDPAHVTANFGLSIDKIEQDGIAEVMLAGRPFTIKKQFLDDVSSHSLTDKISQMKKALLVFHGPLDNTVGIENASEIFLAAKHPKSYISLDKADHLLSNPEDAIFVADTIGSWAKRYIATERLSDHRSHSKEGEVVVSETGEGAFAQIVSVGGNHVLRADEPPTVGGTDSGPAPYDFLLAGLGACTSMTVRMYANRKRWPLENVTVNLSHSKTHATDSETPNGKLDNIERQISFTGDLDEEQRLKLMEIADKCPVHKTLHSPININSTLQEE